MIEFILTVLSYVPVSDLFSHGLSLPRSGDVAGVLGLFYDVAQLIGGLHLIAQGFVKISEATPWVWDDSPARKAVAHTTSAMEWVARIMGALQKK